MVIKIILIIKHIFFIIFKEVMSFSTKLDYIKKIIHFNYTKNSDDQLNDEKLMKKKDFCINKLGIPKIFFNEAKVNYLFIFIKLKKNIKAFHYLSEFDTYHSMKNFRKSNYFNETHKVINFKI